MRAKGLSLRVRGTPLALRDGEEAGGPEPCDVAGKPDDRIRIQDHSQQRQSWTVHTRWVAPLWQTWWAHCSSGFIRRATDTIPQQHSVTLWSSAADVHTMADRSVPLSRRRDRWSWGQHDALALRAHRHVEHLGHAWLLRPVRVVPLTSFPLRTGRPTAAGRRRGRGIRMAGGVHVASSDSHRVADLVRLAAVVLFAVVLFRALAYVTVRSARRRGFVAHNVLVVGAGSVGQRLMRELKARRQYGLVPLGFVDNSLRRQKQGNLPVPLLGNLDQLAELVDVHAVCVVIVAFGSCRERELVEALRTCERARCKIFLVPRLRSASLGSRRGQCVGDSAHLGSVGLAPTGPSPGTSSDCSTALFSSLALCVRSHPFSQRVHWLCGLRLDRGVLFRQNRIGVDGRVFELLKFRFRLMPESSHESDTMWNVAHDHRLGPVGRFLRRTSTGRASPVVEHSCRSDEPGSGRDQSGRTFVERFGHTVPGYTARHRVPAGLTGWAQVHGLRGDTSIEDRAAFDNYYIQNWSLWGDLKIVVRTLQQVVQRCGG